MMKRLTLFSLAFVTTMLSWAITIPSDFRVVCKDGSVARFCGAGTELSFSTDGSVLYIQTEGYDAVVSYAVDGIETIEFAQLGETYEAYDYLGDYIDVAFSPADSTSYTEAKEEVITDEENDDYGDFIENYSPKNTVVITYDGNEVTYKGNTSGVTVIAKGSHVTVTSTKKNISYELKGATTNGSFKLYSDKKAQVNLSGVSITNPTGSAINIQSGKTMLIDLTEGTTNNLEDGASYTLTEDEQQKGAFFSEGQLVFSGKGTLNVKSHYKHGIASDDYVRIRDGVFNIEAVGDGISTKERFVMYGGELAINAGQDGVDVGEGYIEIGGGKLNVQAGDEGITASYEGDEDTGVVDPLITPYIDIKGGFVKVATTGDKGHGLRAMSTLSMSGGIVQTTVKGAGSKALMCEDNMSLMGGKATILVEGATLYEEGDLSSAAGIRCKSTLKIENTTLGIKSTGTGSKGINNVGDIIIKSSRVTAITSGGTHQQAGLSSYSRGIATDGDIILDDCVLLVNSCDEPLHILGEQTFLNESVYIGYKIK